MMLAFMTVDAGVAEIVVDCWLLAAEHLAAGGVVSHAVIHPLLFRDDIAGAAGTFMPAAEETRTGHAFAGRLAIVWPPDGGCLAVAAFRRDRGGRLRRRFGRLSGFGRRAVPKLGTGAGERRSAKNAAGKESHWNSDEA
jgi:hypothetical protein